jgi:small-conductance mechanosensitive channel
MRKATFALIILILFITFITVAYVFWRMKVSVDLDYFNTTTIGGVSLSTYIWLAAIALAAVTLERILTRYLSGFARKARLAPNVANNLILTSRLLILAITVILMVRAGGLPSDWIVTFSALGGAAVGFASTKTIGNFIAGLYLLAARPYRVGDYVRIGAVEGIVHEMAINYTKILTQGNNIVSISNLQIMDRDITNFQYESDDSTGLYCYTFEVAFDHSVPTDKLERIFDEAFNQCETELPKKPDYMLNRSDAFSRVYVVYLYVRHPKDIFDLRPKTSEEIFRLWDRERQKTSQ